MLDKKIARSLKKTNIGKDPTIVMRRVRALWYSLSRAAREEVLDMAGVKLTTLQRAYRTGSISAKLALPLAQAADASPYYITGETEERGAYSDDLAIQMLKTHGYGKEASSLAKKKGWETRHAAAEAAPADDAPEFALSFEEKAPEIAFDDCVALLRSMTLRAEFNPRSAEALQQIKKLLLEM